MRDRAALHPQQVNGAGGCLYQSKHYHHEKRDHETISETGEQHKESIIPLQKLLLIYRRDRIGNPQRAGPPRQYFVMKKAVAFAMSLLRLPRKDGIQGLPVLADFPL